MRQELPALQPLEACAAALAILLYGASHLEAIGILNRAGVGSDSKAGEVSHTVTIRLSPRRKHEATAGCVTDAYIMVLREALTHHNKGENEQCAA